MSYAPCKNPNCKSFGSPHQNCKCYGEMAEGGDVPFCSGMHKQECEYFADGGDIPQNEVVPDQSQEIPHDEVIPDEINPNEVSLDSDKTVPNKYGTPGQQIGTAVEGIAQGIAGPLATGAELGLSKLGVPGLSAEDISGRQAENPWIHGVSEGAGTVGGFLLGTGEAGLALKGAEAIADAAKVGKLGSSILKGAISNGLIQGGDEVSKWMLGQGDQQDPVGSALANTGVSGLFGGIFGAAGSLGATATKKGLEKLVESKFGQQAEYFLHGLVAASKANTPELQEGLEAAIKNLPAAARKGFQAGQNVFDTMTSKIIPPTIGAGAEAYQGYKEDGLEGALKGAGKGFLHGIAFDLAEKALGVATSRVAAPTILRILSSGNLSGAFEAFDHAAEVAKGSQTINRGIDRLFGAPATAAQQSINAALSDRDRKKLDEYIENGGVDQDIQNQIYQQNEAQKPQGFAEGGPVNQKPVTNTDGIATHFPEQNMLRNVAKGRVSNYLKSLRPQQNQPKLAFDDGPDTRSQQKSYDRALHIAAQPLSVLEEIRKGTVEPEHIKHLNSLYPEVSGLLQKRLTERMIKSQLEEEKPPSNVRQSLSMFMGTALSSEYTSQGIQAAQAVFAQKPQPQQQGQSAPKAKNTSKLTKSDQSYLTGGQALQRRSQKV